jgi:hypothetical protein
MWRNEGRPAWATRAVGGGADRRVEQAAEGRRAVGRRSGPGEGGGVQQRRSRGGREEGRRRGTETQYQKKAGTLL